MFATKQEPRVSTGGTPASGTQVTGTQVNGINVGALRGAIEGIQADPANGQTHWEVRSVWCGGTRSDHHVDRCRIGDKVVDRGFILSTDEPAELCGTNQHANPQEYLLSAMNACMMVGYSAVAALMGVRLTRVEIRVEGDIDLRGFLGLDPKVPAGYESLRQVVHLEGDGTPDQLRQIHETVKKTSPNYFNIVNGIPTRTELVLGK